MEGKESIEHITHSYGTLGKDEVQRLQTYVFSLQEEFERVDKKVGQVKGELFNLEKRREVILNTLAVGRSRMAPVHRLPPEVISEILLWACIRGRDEDYNGNREQLQLPRACKRWYEIAMTTPAFWSRLHVMLPSKLSEAEIIAAEAWLRRSRTCPIMLCISDTGSRVTSWNQTIHMLIEKLQLHFERCRRFDVCVPISHINEIFSSLSPGFPRLEYLSLRPPLKDTEPSISVDLSTCPRLAEMQCSYYSLPVVDVKFRGEGAAVRDIQADLKCGDALQLMKCCPLVNHFQLQISEGGTINEAETVFQLSHLTRFFIKCLPFIGHSEVGRFFDRLCLPSLQSMTLHGWKTETIPQTWRHLTRLLERSQPPLIRLSLSRFSFTEAGLVELLSCTPSLQSFKIESCTPGHAFWHALTMANDILPDDSIHSLCPQLTELEVVHCWSFPTEAIAKMVLSRCPEESQLGTSCKNLTSLFLAGDKEVFEILEYPGISSCIDGGLDMKIEEVDRPSY